VKLCRPAEVCTVGNWTRRVDVDLNGRGRRRTFSSGRQSSCRHAAVEPTHTLRHKDSDLEADSLAYWKSVEGVLK